MLLVVDRNIKLFFFSKIGKRKSSDFNQNDNDTNINENIVAGAVANVTKSVRFSDGIAPGCDLAEAEDNERKNSGLRSLQAPNATNSSLKIIKTKSSRNKKISRHRILNSRK